MNNIPKLRIKVADRVKKVGVKSVHTVVSGNYEQLENKPRINGVELIGNLSHSDLMLLSALLSDYTETSLDDNLQGVYILAKDEDGERKIPVSDFLALVSSVDVGGSVDVPNDGVVNKQLDPNVFYNFTGNITALNITFSQGESGRENEYKGQFVTGVTVPAVSFPVGVSWVGDEFPELEAQKTYQFSVLNNVGVIVGV